MIACNCCPTPEACKADAKCWNVVLLEHTAKQTPVKAKAKPDCWHSFNSGKCVNCGALYFEVAHK